MTELNVVARLVWTVIASRSQANKEREQKQHQKKKKKKHRYKINAFKNDCKFGLWVTKMFQKCVAYWYDNALHQAISAHILWCKMRNKYNFCFVVVSLSFCCWLLLERANGTFNIMVCFFFFMYTQFKFSKGETNGDHAIMVTYSRRTHHINGMSFTAQPVFCLFIILLFEVMRFHWNRRSFHFDYHQKIEK